MNAIKNPCYKCKDRKPPSCHSNCKLYSEYKEITEELRLARMEYRQNDVSNYQMDKHRALKKKYR